MEPLRLRPTIAIRRHTGGLHDSLETMAFIPACRHGIADYMRDKGVELTHEEERSISVELYNAKPDNRVGWLRTYAVKYKPNYAEEPVIFGYTDNMVHD